MLATLLRSRELFPVLSMLLATGAVFNYLRAGEWGKAAYWILGGSITFVVTYVLKS